jgi:lipid II:glycine glycyltransferase (peptidoglycan interpeptide bridge formation enzyme)
MLMNYFRKIERGLTALALVPLSNLETNERNRRLDERLRRLEQRQEKAQSMKAKILQKEGYS